MAAGPRIIGQNRITGGYCKKWVTAGRRMTQVLHEPASAAGTALEATCALLTLKSILTYACC